MPSPMVFLNHNHSIRNARSFVYPEVVILYVNYPYLTFASNLHFGLLRNYWKGICKERIRENGIHHTFIYSVP
jgi:hypothetical protein